MNSFDKLYQSAIKDISENKKNIAEFLEEKFNKLDNDLSTKNVLWGLRFDKKEHIEEFCLEKLPLSFLI